MTDKIKSNNIRKCIVKDSKQIRALLEERFAELELSGRDIVADAHKHNYLALRTEPLSRYRKRGNTTSTLSQQDIIWLCFRYGIEINLSASKYQKYNEKECLKKLKKEF